MASFIKLIIFIILLSISKSIEIERLYNLYYLKQNSMSRIYGGNTASMLNLTNFEGNEINIKFEIKNNKSNIDTLYYRYDNSTFPINNFYTNYSVKLNNSYTINY